jgi:GMP synthase-like glutamine amidotransferase
MRLLSVVHGPDVRGEVFDDVVRADGHELDEWWIVEHADPPRRLADYDAVLVFGGAMNVDQEDEHPWLVREDEFVRGLVERGVPTLGVCLGGQLLAKAAGAHVGPSPEPEFGFSRATLLESAAGDPLFGGLPRELEVWNAHGYAFHVPDGAVELARSRVCSQAFRLGDAAWGVQFHPEIRVEQVARWLTEDRVANARELVEELRGRYDSWRAFGTGLLRSFLSAAAARAPARSSSSG